VIEQFLFLAAYAASGLAGLIYEVSWTRLLTLYMGHSTAAASAVVAAFMGGLAVGAVAGGRLASRLSRRQCLRAYVTLELIVVGIALLLPLELTAFTPILRATYENGAPNLLFPAIRVLSCLAMMFVPAAALGATFPVAVRWFVITPERAGGAGGALYAVNTAGAATGALLAGFVLIPAIGVAWTTRAGIAASLAAVVAVLGLSWHSGESSGATLESGPERARPRAIDDTSERRRRRSAPATEARQQVVRRRWLAGAVLGLTGFGSLVYEIAWTRVVALTIGPTIYAFSATLAALIGGIALGSAFGAWIAARARRTDIWLALVLAEAAAGVSWASGLAGHDVPLRVAQEVALMPEAFDHLLTRGAMLVAALILPTAAGLGAAFPLAFATMGGSEVEGDGSSISAELGSVYAVNTLAAVAGSLLAGFVFIPRLGLQQTLQIVASLVILASLLVVFFGRLSRVGLAIGGLAAVGTVAMLVLTPPWDRALVAGGGYIYAPYVPKALDLETALKTGSLLYYRDGASATVSIKKLTGTLSLAIDGKVDASNRSDMLTQKIVAHLPLLLHGHPRTICIIGLGSGVTLGSALRHPIERADVVELSPEVVDASRYFAEENRHALDDPRTRLIVGDGRSHLLLSSGQYDVIISEPSNPWIAGVASLFTREFFAVARERLAPGGIICQWAHTYNISDRDLRSIIATFTSVFPNGTAWLIGQEDILLVASSSPLDSRFPEMQSAWERPGVAEDLATVGAREPFALWSLFVGGPAELAQYGQGSTILTDDTSTLEFSAPRELHGRSASENAANLSALVAPEAGPPFIRGVRAGATAANWRDRGAMMFRSDMFATAYDDAVRALAIDPVDEGALDGLVQAAVMTGRFPEALSTLNAIAAKGPETAPVLIARSKILAATGSQDDAVMAARTAGRVAPGSVDAAEQLASLYSDTGKIADLEEAVATLRRIAPDRAPTLYYAAALSFLHQQFADAVTLASRAVAADPNYAAVYDLAGAAHLKLGDFEAARAAFETSLRYNAHDSSAYANLGLIELAAKSGDRAVRNFAEALWLDPESETAREGLAQARSRAIE